MDRGRRLRPRLNARESRHEGLSLVWARPISMSAQLNIVAGGGGRISRTRAVS
jgi:hypothetical protein